MKTLEVFQKALCKIVDTNRPLVQAKDEPILRTSWPLGNFPGSAVLMVLHISCEICGGLNGFPDFVCKNIDLSLVVFVVSSNFLSAFTGHNAWCDPSGSNNAGKDTFSAVLVMVSFLYKNPGLTAMITFS